VAIRATGGAAASASPFGNAQRSDAGAGIVLGAAGVIITNDHVVAGASSITVALDGQSAQTRHATVLAEDSSNDLALLKISPSSVTLHALALASSATVQVGDPAYAIGNPFGLNWTLTTGVVSALNRQIQAPNGTTISHVIQTDAALNPGNSGGPLIDAAGSVIGINSQIVSSSSSTGGQGGSSGVGFAISSNTIKAFLQRAHVGL
jgi:putative serine protease PepD